MKREDFRIIQIDKFNGYNKTTTEYLIQHKKWCLFIPFWSYYNCVNSIGYAENLIKDEIARDEAYKRRKTTKTIVG